jgi:toxin ParE1/3/4
MGYKIRFTNDARQDLRDIYEYIALNLTAEKAAGNLMAEIEKSVMNLADFPCSSPFLSDDRLRQLGYRKLIIKKYIAVYAVDEKSKTVNILRFFYGPSDYMKYL